MARHTGVVIIKIDGKSLPTMEGATINLGGDENTPVFANGEVVGYSGKPTAAEISFTTAHSHATDEESIQELVDGLAEFVCDKVGTTYSISNAFRTSPLEVGDAGSGMKIVVSGKAAKVVK